MSVLLASTFISATIPAAYVSAAAVQRIPADVMWCVCLQESAIRLGEHNLPWPWTLNIDGQPQRYASKQAALVGLSNALAQGVDSVDVGLGQINVRWHAHRFNSLGAMLDPDNNLRVAARILAEQAATSASWFEAVGKYHAPNNVRRANAYAQSVVRRCQQWRAQHG